MTTSRRAARAHALFDSADQTFVRNLLTKTEHDDALFDGADDWFVRHLLEGTDESLPADSTDAAAESAPAQSASPPAAQLPPD